MGGKNHDLRLSVQIPFLREIKLSGVTLNDKFDKDKSDDKFDKDKSDDKFEYHIAPMATERRAVCALSRLKNILSYRSEEAL